jgi:hypothetical protein
MYDSNKDFIGVWVTGAYEGSQAKEVLAMADIGIGYKVIERNKSGSSCIVSFVYSGEMPIPKHLVEVKDPYKISDLNKWRNRNSQSSRKEIKRASDEKVNEIRTILAKKGKT